MSKSTMNYKTKTMNIARDNVHVDNIWGLGLDIGYSSVKGMSPNNVFRFPSYARKTKQMLSMAEPDITDIYYKDLSTGEVWVVGEKAQAMITLEETSDSSQALYGRNRYYDPMFLVTARVGMGFGLLSNEFGSPSGKPFVLQTGLPPKYMKTDKALLQDVLEGHHEFELKIGTGSWQKFVFDLPKDNIIIIPQPMGGLMSICMDKDGNLIPEAKKYLNSAMLIFDPGFGTFDVFNIRGGEISNYETFDNLGMKRVFQETSDAIFKKYGTEIPVHAFQKFLESGTVPVIDRKTNSKSNQDFAEILYECSEKVCREAIQKINSLYNNLYEHEYLVITGGTGAAWDGIIRNYYTQKNPDLEIISGNKNDNLSCVFSNVRGYYMYLYNNLKKQA